jgi:hypothetical protein
VLPGHVSSLALEYTSGCAALQHILWQGPAPCTVHGNPLQRRHMSAWCMTQQAGACFTSSNGMLTCCLVDNQLNKDKVQAHVYVVLVVMFFLLKDHRKDMPLQCFHFSEESLRSPQR